MLAFNDAIKTEKCVVNDMSSNKENYFLHHKKLAILYFNR